MTSEELDELERLERDATPEGWYAVGNTLYITSNVPAQRDIDWVALPGNSVTVAFIAALRNAAKQLIAAARERDELRTRLLSAAGDDLCRLTQEEIKAYTSGEVQIPPEEEFIPSCRQFWRQTADKSGVLKGCLTMAQLIAENERLTAERDEAVKLNARISDGVAKLIQFWPVTRQIAEGSK